MNQKQCRDGGVVETAKTSHMSGAAELRPHRMVLGYGKSQYASQGRPTVDGGENSGAGPANSVMASADLMEYTPGLAAGEERIAEMKRAGVADTDPPHEVDDGEAQPMGMVTPQMPTPFRNR